MDFKETYPDTCSTVAIVARSGDVMSLKRLIKDDCPVDVKDNRGWMAIHETAFRGHNDCLKVLLVTGNVNVEERTFEMETPLLLAARGGNFHCVQTLLQAGADPNAATLEGLSPLWEACLVTNVQCVELLVSSHAHVNHITYTQDTPLHGLIQNADHEHLVSLLLRNGADIRKCSENGLTPLFVAAQFGRVESLKILIQEAEKKGKRFLSRYVNLSANDMATPLYIATQERHIECVELLLCYHGNPALGPIMDTDEGEIILIPLLAAVKNGDVRCVELLAPAVDQHPEMLKTFSDDSHPLMLALSKGDVRIVSRLLQYSPQRRLVDWITATNNLYCAVTIAKKFPGHDCQGHLVGKLALDICYNVSGSVEEEMILLLLRLRAQLENRLPRLKYDVNGINGNLLMYMAQRKYCCLRNCQSQDPDVHRDVCKQWYRTACFHREKMCLQSNVKSMLKIFSLLDEDKQELFNAFDTLQHKCRVTIVLQLLVNDRFTREIISSLPIPQPLKSYLQFRDLAEVGDSVMRHCERLVELEERIDEVFTKLKFKPCLIPNS